jgi:hypothetical protein
MSVSLRNVDAFLPATPLARKAHLLLETPGAEAPVLEDGDALEALLAQLELSEAERSQVCEGAGPH